MGALSFEINATRLRDYAAKLDEGFAASHVDYSAAHFKVVTKYAKKVANRRKVAKPETMFDYVCMCMGSKDDLTTVVVCARIIKGEW